MKKIRAAIEKHALVDGGGYSPVLVIDGQRYTTEWAFGLRDAGRELVKALKDHAPDYATLANETECWQLVARLSYVDDEEEIVEACQLEAINPGR